jgi:hypothetical protein
MLNVQTQGRIFLPRDFTGRKLVNIAPDPVFTRFNGANQRVLGTMEMLGCMLVLRGITAANVSAFQTKPQVDPRIAKFNALFADINICLRNLDLFHVRTALSQEFLLRPRR